MFVLNLNAEEKTPLKSVPSLPLFCPSEYFGNPEPILKITQSGAPSLLVCSSRDFDLPKGGVEKLLLTTFKVISLTGRTAQPEIFFDSKNEEETYRIIPLEQGVQISERYTTKKGEIPLLSFSVKCSEKGCRRGRKVCVIPKKEKNPFPHALDDWKKRIHKSEGVEVGGEAPLDELVDQLFEQALSGDQNAFRAFDQSDTLEKLPRDAKKIYQSHSRALKRAQSGGCFKGL